MLADSVGGEASALSIVETGGEVRGGVEGTTASAFAPAMVVTVGCYGRSL